MKAIIIIGLFLWGQVCIANDQIDLFDLSKTHKSELIEGETIFYPKQYDSYKDYKENYLQTKYTTQLLKKRLKILCEFKEILRDPDLDPSEEKLGYRYYLEDEIMLNGKALSQYAKLGSLEPGLLNISAEMLDDHIQSINKTLLEEGNLTMRDGLPNGWDRALNDCIEEIIMRGDKYIHSMHGATASIMEYTDKLTKILECPNYEIYSRLRADHYLTNFKAVSRWLEEVVKETTEIREQGDDPIWIMKEWIKNQGKRNTWYDTVTQVAARHPHEQAVEMEKAEVDEGRYAAQDKRYVAIKGYGLSYHMGELRRDMVNAIENEEKYNIRVRQGHIEPSLEYLIEGYTTAIYQVKKRTGIVVMALISHAISYTYNVHHQQHPKWTDMENRLSTTQPQ